LKANAEGRGKKAYEKPVLRVYGDLQTMTQATSPMTGMLDGITVFKMALKTS
jgi:hypothetical protein